MNFELTFEPVVPLNQPNQELADQLAKYSRLVDLKIFSPSECGELQHCTESTDNA